MKNIKFRAWDKKNKKMITMQDGHFEFYDDTWIVSKGCSDCYEPILTSNDGELMQFSGLLDKNGKEIYEGDFVIYNTGERWKVAWSHRNAMFEYRLILNKRTFLRDKQHVDSSEFGISNHLGSHEIEIIGNIYENPNLINL